MPLDKGVGGTEGGAALNLIYIELLALLASRKRSLRNAGRYFANLRDERDRPFEEFLFIPTAEFMAPH